MVVKQFKYSEFRTILTMMLKQPKRYALSSFSRQKIMLILSTDYPEQIDDIEYLIDMINYYIRKNQLSYYRNHRSAYLNTISRYLNEILTSEFYIDERKVLLFNLKN